MKESAHRSLCPIATALDVIGDRWTLVVVRDIFLGKKRYQEFLSGPERITTNILAQRLSYLEEAGLVAKSIYQEHPPRYEYALTDKGKALAPVLTSLWDWSQVWEQGHKTASPSPFAGEAGAARKKRG
jgi:DNA-binding HxlR family transcriptional regulator